MKKTTFIIVASTILAIGLGIGAIAINAINSRKGSYYSAFDDSNFTVSKTDANVKTDNTQRASGTTAATDKAVQSTQGTQLIGEERARQIALERAGLAADDVTFERTELDLNDGVAKYEIEFRQGRTEYDVEINAYDGSLLSFEKDIDD